jgi:hypothetical protein
LAPRTISLPRSQRTNLNGPVPIGWAPNAALRLDQVTRHDLRLSHRDDGHERHDGCVQGHLHGVPVQSDETRHRPGAALSVVAGALDAHEVLGDARVRLRVEQPRERIDDILGDDLAPVMELHALAQLEGPRQAVPRGSPEFRERRLDRQGLVELDEPSKICCETLRPYVSAIRAGSRVSGSCPKGRR